MRILVIEDDEALGRQVVQQLEQAGLTVVWWRTGRRIDESDLPDVAQLRPCMIASLTPSQWC